MTHTPEKANPFILSANLADSPFKATPPGLTLSLDPPEVPLRSFGIGLGKQDPALREIPLTKAMAWSTGLHIVSPVVLSALLAVVLLLLSWLWHMNFWDWFKSPKKYQDIEFVLVPDTHTPKPDKALYKGEHNQEAGGKTHAKQKPQPKANPKVEDTTSTEAPEPHPHEAVAAKPPSQTKTPTPRATAQAPQPVAPILPVTVATAPTEPTDATALTAVSSAQTAEDLVPPGTLVASTEPTTPGGSPLAGTSGNPETGPGQTPGVSVMQTEFGPYMSEIKRRLTRNWRPPRGEQTKEVVLLFEIARDGTLVKAEVNTSSGEALSDEAALNAVKLSAPFKALPEGFQGESIPILFSFNYTVYGSSSRSSRMTR